jgi:hypothetical protein
LPVVGRVCRGLTFAAGVEPERDAAHHAGVLTCQRNKSNNECVEANNSTDRPL